MLSRFLIPAVLLAACALPAAAQSAPPALRAEIATVTTATAEEPILDPALDVSGSYRLTTFQVVIVSQGATYLDLVTTTGGVDRVSRLNGGDAIEPDVETTVTFLGSSSSTYNLQTSATVLLDKLVVCEVTTSVARVGGSDGGGGGGGGSSDLTIASYTADHTVSDDESAGTVWLDNAGAAGEVIFSLPPATAGKRVLVRVVAAQSVRLKAATGDNLRTEAGTSATAGYMRSTRVASTILATAVDTTTWEGEARGTWAFDSTSSAGFAYTPTAEIEFTPTGSWTNTTYFGRYRQLGNYLEIYYHLTLTGEPASSAQLSVALPSGFVVSATTLGNPYVAPLGRGLYVDAISSGQFAAIQIVQFGGDALLYPYTTAIPGVGLTKSLFGTHANYRVMFDVRVPVQ